MNKLFLIIGFNLFVNIKLSICQKKKEKYFNNLKYCPNINGTKPSKSSNCWTWNPVEQVSNLRTGCDDLKCSNAVCECDPYCCQTSWDLACVGYSSESNANTNKDNPFSNGCSAHRLCCGNDDITLEDSIIGNQVICNSTDKTIGYNSINDLNEDISTLDIDTFILCPNTVYNLQATSSGIKPIRNSTRVQCGKDGSSNNNCTLIGGNSHILFNYSVVVVDVVFQGLKFKESLGASLSAWGPSTSYASFLDCHWRNNVGYDTVDILYQESNYRRTLLDEIQQYDSRDNNQAVFNSITNNNFAQSNKNRIQYLRSRKERMNQEIKQTSMTIIFNDCSFTNNRQNIGVILNVGGVVQLINSRFKSNVVSGVTVGVAGGGRLLVDPQTSFINNTNYFSTIFIDYDSSLTLSPDTSGYNNTGNICNDVFREDFGSSCLGGGSAGSNTCSGSCTELRK